MRPENEIAPETGGSQGANEKQISVTRNEYAALGTSAPDDYRDPTDLHLRTLPTIAALPSHGHLLPRAGSEHLSDASYESALNGFVLGEIIFDIYAKQVTLQERYSQIAEGLEMAREEDAKHPGTMHGFIAHIVAVIEGYVALAQNAPGATETFQ